LNITLNSAVTSIENSFKIGIIHYTKIIVSQSPQMIKGRTQLYQESLFFDFQDEPVTERPGIKEWRTLWKAFGADPNRHRHSAESLMRRIAKQNYLTPIHSAVDLNNFFSLQYEIPIGIYDVEKIDTSVEITLGDENCGYEGLNGRFNSLKNIVHTKDDTGAFGSPFVDSARTATSEQTTEAIQIFYLRPSLPEAQCNELLQAAGKMFTQVNGGDFSTHLLTKDVPTISL
jgi:DNA/RNA-binding domain of Phe-tRNA-synthetase-like protein